MDSRQLNLVLIAANAGLILTILVMLFWMRDRPGTEVSLDSPAPADNIITQIAVRKFNASNLLAELSKRSLGWASIESTNYLFYINNLRSFGCPEQTVRDIILTDIANLYARRRAEVLAAAPPFQYWRTVGEGEDPLLHPELEEALANLDRERDRLIRDLLNVDFDTEIARYTGTISKIDRLYAFLPPAKRAQVISTLESIATLRRELLEGSGGVLLPADEARLRELDRQREAELARLLTPEEFRSYQLIASPLAQELRYDLHGFDPSPEEFASIYDIRKNFNDVVDSALAMDELEDPEMRERVIRDAEALMEEEIRKTLGAERYESLQQALDPDYQFLVKWTDRLNINEAVADRIYTMKTQAQRQRERIEANLALDYEQRQEAYAAIAQETERTLSRLLGEETYRQYRQAGGQWIEALGPTEDAFELIVPEIKEAIAPGTPP